MIGRKLDKYEILEEVGQGGMAVVYKGLDTSLHREVAVKVLHPHLASHEEAKKRFEREARAVAKLRHENILEIFDYSGKDSADSYIVTEFIRGRTLKEFVGEHTIGYPEIGAMIVVEVCRALAHAHAGGVLHRDVKPENIMIRDDGIVKLTDFGIAQILDAQRMTVTGQLLGSPAYMAPEHVEGKPLDFRTDVFAVGILLYQLTTGELPFKGRNPHEILKKIADCKYLDARVVNPLVGDRLNRIITKALAKEPGERYQDVQLLLDDLVRFLAEVEIGDPRSELGQFFAKPASYEQALRQRLIGALSKRGKTELAGKRTAVALELFNRVLTIDPSNEVVLAEMDRLSRRKRATRGITIGAAALVVAAGAAVAWVKWPRDARQDPDRLVVGPSMAVADAGIQVAMPAAPPVDAAVTVAVATTQADAAVKLAVRSVPHNDPKGVNVKGKDDRVVTPPPVMTMRKFTLNVNPKGKLEISIDGGPVQPCTPMMEVSLGPGEHTLTFTHPVCETTKQVVAADEPGKQINILLRFKEARVRAQCAAATFITVAGRRVESNTVAPIPMSNATKEVEVDFLIAGNLQSKTVTVRAGEPDQVVQCEAQ